MDKPNDHKKSFLTHAQKGAGEPSSEHGGIIEAQPAAMQRPSQAALSEKMAKISSIRESGGPSKDVGSFSEKNKGASSLPKAMARVHHKLQEDKIREQLRGKPGSEKPVVKKPDLSGNLSVGDPQPGMGKSLLWFLFAYGRFAKGVLLAQTWSVTVLFLMICGLGSIQFTMGWLSPLGGPGQIYDSQFALRVLGGGMLLGMGSYLLASTVIHLVLRKTTSGIGKLFGLKIVVDAFLPLALAQLLVLIYATYALGESFWRGHVPAGYGVVAGTFLPALWIWGGYRIAQAITGLFALPLPKQLALKAGITLGMALPILLTVSVGSSRSDSRVGKAWELLQEDFMGRTGPLPAQRFTDLEGKLPFRDVERKKELYLLRMENLYQQDFLDAARADALRLDRMAPGGSADDELAKGLNYLFQDRLDLAIPRFESAILKDPESYPAHQWLSLGLLATDIAKSEAHARILMQEEPNVFHLQLLVRILFAQEKYQDIWDAMLMVDAPPEAWDPVTLYQGGVAAKQLDKLRRSELLFSIARSKGLESEME